MKHRIKHIEKTVHHKSMSHVQKMLQKHHGHLSKMLKHTEKHMEIHHENKPTHEEMNSKPKRKM